MKNIMASTILTAAVLMSSTVNAEQCKKEFYSPAWDAQAPMVDAYNYTRAETDLQFKGYADRYKAFGKFNHGREVYDVDNQITLSGNRDTIYSFGVFDLSKSPLTITMPDPDGRYMTLMPLSQDHDIYPALSAPGKWTFTEKEIGTRYLLFVVRTFADPNSKEDMAKAHKLQDNIVVVQKDKGSIDGIPEWNKEQMLVLRKAFNAQASSLSDSSSLFGVKCDRSYFQNAMGIAIGWGGLQRKDALYIPGKVEKNDGKTAYKITVPKNVPVDGFWSVTVYNKDRFMVKNKYNSYSFNNVTAKKADDGSITLHFGGDPKSDNYLPIMKGWVYIVRFYKPREEILTGKWKFPEAVPVK